MFFSLILSPSDTSESATHFGAHRFYVTKTLRQAAIVRDYILPLLNYSLLYLRLDALNCETVSSLATPSHTAITFTTIVYSMRHCNVHYRKMRTQARTLIAFFPLY